MFYTAEVRWFIPGQLPEEVRDWFTAGQDLVPERKRTDEYLLFPGCDSVGVKLREGRLEIKAVVSASWSISLGTEISGRTDQWVKWSFANEGLCALEGALHQSGRWIKVEKERLVRRFSADTGSLVEVPPGRSPLPVIGCNVELTQIEVEAEPGRWYSPGFEAFGSPGMTARILDETVRQFFRENGPVPGTWLTGRNSFSYPSWLATLG